MRTVERSWVSIGLSPDFAQRVDEFRRGAEIGHLLGVGEVEQDVAVGVEGRAVVEQQRRAGGQAGNQPVPHHPAAGGEIEQAVAVLEAAMELLLLEVLEQRAAGRMHDAFRDAGRARREQDVERVARRAAARR